MSRTGVECRVMIDGLQLDDGCIDWGGHTYGDPWTEVRRVLNIDPAAASASLAAWIGTTGTWARVDGSALGMPYAKRHSASQTGATRPGMLVQLAPSTLHTIRFRVRAQTARSTWQVSYRHVSTGGSTPTIATGVLFDGTARDYEFTFTTGAGTPLATSGIYLINTTSQTNEWVEISRFNVEQGNTVGQGYLDGDSLAPDEAHRNRWLATLNASPSVQEVGTYQSSVPDDMLPEGVSAGAGLQITWGRETTVDQPPASTCTFTVVDDPGGSTVLQLLKMGSTVDVFADAVISGGGPASQPAFDDPDFDTSVRSSSTNQTVTRSAERTQSGGFSARLVRPNPRLQGTVQLPPGQLQAPGTNPAAWVQLATTKPGETWTIAADVWVPPGMQVTMRPVLYDGPYQTAATPLLDYEAVTFGSWGWVPLSITFAPGADAAWVGFQFETVGTTTWGQAEGTWATTDPATRWVDYEAIFIDGVAVTNPDAGTASSALVFSGRITDMEGVFSTEWGAPAMDVTATDFLGDLGNRYIGDEPWPQEILTTRVSRIVTLAAAMGGTIQVQIAPTVSGVMIAPDDVDNRAASGLLTDVAQSVDGVLWSATHPVIGPYLRIEDPAQRLPLYQLALEGGEIVIIPAIYTGDDAPPSVSSCDVLRDPVTFTMSVADIATRATVTWLEAGTDEEGEPTSTERHYTVVDSLAELDAGTRAVNLSTQLTTQADAARVADQLIARLASSWRITGLAVDDATVTVPDATAARMLMMLLNGVTRGGQPLLLTDLPEWSPVGATAPIYLEGGTYAFSGGWALDLNVSRAAGIGRNVAWDALPRETGWTWDSWQPGITWDDLRGVAAPTP